MQESLNKKTIYFPGLNGLRAIAAIAVVICHVSLSLRLFNLDLYFYKSFQNGYPIGAFLADYGVSVFFSLSGFLITYLLQTEKKYHSIDIKKFYLRRILRIWPLYYLYLIISITIAVCLGNTINISSLLLYIFYAANIPSVLSIGLPYLYHYWSLGIEEQFYIFWPWFNKKVNSLILPVIVLIILLISIKLVVHFLYMDSVWDKILHAARFQSMMIGALGAILYNNENKLFLYIADNKITQFVCWLIILLAVVNRFHIATIIDNEIISIVALFLIIGQINVKNRLINLDISVLNFLGKISYGIYIIHPLVIFLFSKLAANLNMPTPYKYFTLYFGILGTSIMIAYISYTCFEMRFLKFKQKFAVVHSSSISNNLA
jgi:peptidoglycan/LPS O-acetylase OafA/YrhL